MEGLGYGRYDAYAKIEAEACLEDHVDLGHGERIVLDLITRVKSARPEKANLVRRNGSRKVGAYMSFAIDSATCLG